MAKRSLTGDCVEEDEVLEVGDLATLPTLTHVGGLEKLLWCGQGNTPKNNALLLYGWENKNGHSYHAKS